MARARLDGEERRRSIVESAMPLFARRGFAGTTTREIARQAGVSEALLFQHFPSKAALYQEILAQGCEGDPALARLMSSEPSTAALVEVTHLFVRHFVGDGSEEAQTKHRLMLNSFLEDGDYARLVFGWVQDEIYPWFAACLDAAERDGDLQPGRIRPENAFWLAEHIAAFIAYAHLGGGRTVPYVGDTEQLIADATRFMLRGHGLSDTVIDRYWPHSAAERGAAGAAATPTPPDPAMASSMTFEETRERPSGPRKPVSRVRLAVGLVLMALLIALLGGALWGFNHMREKGMAAYFASMVPPPTAVSAASAQSGPMPRYLAGIGSLTSVQEVDVAPELAGRVSRILFEAGAEVKAGAPLVQLNDEEERADLGTFQAQATLAQANLGRTTKLATRDFASQATLDTNQSALDQARAGIARTQAVIDQKLIKAPFEGQLGIRQVQLGQYVSPGTVLVTLTDLDPLYVNFTLPEQTRAEVEVGRKVEVRVDAFPGRAFEAELTTVEPQIDPSTRTIKLQATLPNPDKLLLPGMFANARLILPPDPDVVTVPETAVTQTLYGDSVYVVKDEKGADGKPLQKAVQTFVETGSVADGRIVIKRGVQAGDVVVASGQLKLHNGAAVTIAPDSTALAVPATPPVQ